MAEWENKTLDLKEVPQLYLEKAGEWLLLEIIKTDKQNNPTGLRLVAHSPRKDELHDYVSEDSEWEWNRRYLLVLADPTKPCTIPPIENYVNHKRGNRSG